VDAASWQRVDDVPMTGTTDYVLQLTNSATSYLELTFGNTTATCIREVSAVVAYRSAATAANTGTRASSPAARSRSSSPAT
jgi:hypothetical protein